MIIHSRIESSHLAGNLLGDPSERDLFVYLPPGYEESDRRYPTAYLLHAFGSSRSRMVTPATDGERWRPPLEDVLDPVFGRMGVGADDRRHPRRRSPLGLRPVGRLAGDRQLRAVRGARRDPARRRAPTGRSRKPEAAACSVSPPAGSARGTSPRGTRKSFGAMAVLSADSFLDMTHKFMLYKYLDSIWPEAPNGPVEGNFWSEIVYDYSATYSPNPDNPPYLRRPSGRLPERRADPGGLGPLAQLRPGRQRARPPRQPPKAAAGSCSTRARTTTTTCIGATGSSATI